MPNTVNTVISYKISGPERRWCRWSCTVRFRLGRHPLIIVLHGSAGAYSRLSADVPKDDDLGERTLAESCFVVALPHYFDLIGAKSATDPSLLKREFPTFLRGLEMIVRAEGDLPETREAAIGVLAESYGGYLAIALAGKNPRIGAISEYGGGWPEEYGIADAKHLRCEIFHGGKDTIVPPSAAVALANRLLLAGASVSLHLYPNQEHYLNAETRQEMLETTLLLFRSALSNFHACALLDQERERGEHDPDKARLAADTRSRQDR